MEQRDLGNGVKVSYKRTSVCETTTGVKAYSGYIHLPPGTLSVSQPYPINTFFWYFSSRKDSSRAPISLFFNGGPGGSSLLALFAENGPCFVNSDSTTTRRNQWSWTTEANMLYIDQPNQTGFSYDFIGNFTVSRHEGEIIAPLTGTPPETNSTFFVGKLASQIQENTANTTATAAETLWHSLQGWVRGFPHHHWKSPRRPKRYMSIWAQSYGGKFGPALGAFIQHQNEKIASNRLDAVTLPLDTVGIINGCIDDLIQGPSYLEMATNNTYDIEIFNTTEAAGVAQLWDGPGACKDQILECRRLAALHDPESHGDVSAVNDACHNAFAACSWTYVSAYFYTQKANYYDIAMPWRDAHLPYHLGYLMQKEVLDDIGVPLNFTSASNAAYYASVATGDSVLAGRMEDIEYLLDSGVKVSMLYGDRDYICNWYGGEAVSLSLKHKGARDFRKAGYADLLVAGKSYGKVRQSGNLSFTRLYQAGHQAPAYQPEASYEVFMRSLRGVDTATGTQRATSSYATRGPKDVRDIKLVPPVIPAGKCYVLSPFTCSNQEWTGTVAGQTVVKDYIVVG
ncbi:Alpha/Beta hydrolase protein [Sphaerosporella brunnea]|uniref:Alpha/Beta hydrolase protein n=1 Tax=Sphaerosporella brunnea TaxID=1250544 RepID=A0A5J5EDG3_9PEZI|nr:Alpha/Beta hydrolase protein [Sphaerosporella brunnea]